MVLLLISSCCITKHSPFLHSHPKTNRITQWKQTFIIIGWVRSEGTFKEGLGHHWGDAEFPRYIGCQHGHKGSHLISVDIKFWNRNHTHATAAPPKHAGASHQHAGTSHQHALGLGTAPCPRICQTVELPVTYHSHHCHNTWVAIKANKTHRSHRDRRNHRQRFGVCFFVWFFLSLLYQ